MAEKRCVVCGSPVYSTEIPPLLFRGMTLYFRCQACLEYFASDTDRFIRQGADHNPCLERNSHGNGHSERKGR